MTTTYTIERQLHTYGEGAGDDWEPLATLRDFTIEDAQEWLKRYANRYGTGRVRIVRHKDIEKSS